MAQGPPASNTNAIAASVRWVLKHPSEAVTVVTVTLLLVLAVLQIIGTSIGAEWFMGALAALLSTMTISFLVDRKAVLATSRTVEKIKAEVSRVLTSELVREVPAGAIGSELDSLLSSAEQWTFRGGSARWQRSNVLPQLAKVTHTDVRYRAQVINPFSEALCEEYAQYRRTSRAGTSASRPAETAHTIQYELLAFIYLAAFYSCNSRLKPEIGVVDTFSPLRLDGSQDAVMLTVADSSKAGLLSRRGGWHYNSILDEFAVQFGKRQIALPPVVSGSTAHTSDSVKAFYLEMKSENREIVPSNAFERFGEDDWKAILDLTTLNRGH